MILLPELPTYDCLEFSISHFPAADDPIWERVEEVQLLETEFAGEPRLSTAVSSFWSRERGALFFRFTSNDDHIVSNMLNHDDPLYDEDVVEAFISPTGDLTAYKEFQVSPTNVKFDAAIVNIPGNKLVVGTEWHAEGWETQTTILPDQSGYTSVWEIKLASFEVPMPSEGEQWRLNWYRIDRGKDGRDEYLAWSPTGAINYHIPERFGYLRFAGAAGGK